jgi:DNA polymerase-1
MVEIDRRIRARQIDARMILQIHDELLFDLPRTNVRSTAESIRSCMQEVLPLAVPVVVDCSSGQNWSDMEKL